MKEDQRTPKKVLRLTNLCHQHFTQCRDFFRKGSLVALTYRKMFGKYFHNIVVHAPIYTRIFCGSAMNAENKERLFCAAKSITARTSSNQNSHVTGNLIVRLQAEEKLQQT